MKSPELVELTVESLAFEGYGVARKGGVVHFVSGALPGDVVRAYIKKKKSNYCVCDISEVIISSKYRREAICKYFGECGGCTLQNLDYEQQLFWKRQFVRDAFERIGGFWNIAVNKVIPSPKEYCYRNKMEFSFADKRWLMKSEIGKLSRGTGGNCFLGLHPRACYFKVIDLDECYLLPKIGIKILNCVRQEAINYNLSGYNNRTGDGFLRNLVLRFSRGAKTILVILVTKSPQLKEEEDFLSLLKFKLPLVCEEIKSIVHCVNDSKSPVNVDNFYILYGQEFLNESFLGIDFRISPFSFFQTNSYQLENFMQAILDYAEVGVKDVVWDLFCGTGAISLAISRHCDFVYGFELYDKSVEDAKINAELNGINNVEFRTLNLQEKSEVRLLASYSKPNVVILDPPRTGIHKNLVNLLLEIKAEKIVYVSCNPATQARDCKLLGEVYEIREIQPVDMFPQTFHIESIAKLCLKNE